MNYFTLPDHIFVSAKGQAPTTFQSATFKASVHTVAKTGPEAKELAKERIQQIMTVISSFKEKAGIETDRLSTSFAVDVNKRYDNSKNTHIFDGYKATYNISFTGRDVSAATELHDALTSIDGIEAATPVFNVDDSEVVQNAAYRDAYQKAEVKFSTQCQVLGLDRFSYKIKSWSIDDSPRGGGKMLSLNDGPSVVEIEPGRAMLEMKVIFAFVPRV